MIARTWTLTVAALTFAWLSPPLAVAQGYTGGPVRGGGTISGQVTWIGSRPKAKVEPRRQDTQTCGAQGIEPAPEVGPGGELAGVIVYLRGIEAGKPMAPVEATLDQVKCAYTPRVQAVPVGSNLTIVNSDAILHNIHAYLGVATLFNFAMPMKNQRLSQTLRRPGFLRLSCDVHRWMRATVGVMDNPYFAVTGANGRFALGEVPPGTYTIAAFDPILGEKTAQVTVAPGAGEAAVGFQFGG